MPLTLPEIKRAVRDIVEEQFDEDAHKAEDELRTKFIEHVAAAADKELAEMAREVLKTGELGFSHWYA